MRSQCPYFGNDQAVALARHLLDDFRRGRVPVWPSTVEHANRLVMGLSILQISCPDEVVNAIVHAPRDQPVRWTALLFPLVFSPNELEPHFLPITHRSAEDEVISQAA